MNFNINEKELLELLQELIRIESINPTLSKKGSGEAEIAKYIGDYLKEIGLEVKHQDIGDGRLNTIGILKGTGSGKSIMLNGHTDTVSISGMEIEPFNPVFKEGKVYGRGANDMKSGLAAIILAIKTLIENNIKIKGDIILTFVADEEYASLGTEKLIEEYHADAAIICEPSNLQIVIAHKGFAWIKVIIHGKSAHGSLPEFGVDAIVKGGKFLAKLEDLEKMILSQKKHPLLSSPSLHASLIKGGIELSTYPDYCEIQLERRTLPGEDRDYITQEIKNLITNLSGEDNKFKADFDLLFYRSPLEVSSNQPIAKSLFKICSEVLNRKIKFSGFSGWTDAAILNDAGIPTILFGAKGVGSHSSLEYVDFKSVVSTARILIGTILDFCN
ncbi:MAG: ArgE/DapE family deacylase [Promethearchaeota archaeon]